MKGRGNRYFRNRRITRHQVTDSQASNPTLRSQLARNNIVVIVFIVMYLFDSRIIDVRSER